jgi:L-rhamnose mutarotase
MSSRICTRARRVSNADTGHSRRANLLDSAARGELRSRSILTEKGTDAMKRYGSVIKVRPETIAEYKRYHVAVWPAVLDTIRKCNIRNYSIYLKDDFLFAYFEYHGTDYKADMAKMAADPKTQEWWAVMMPMQRPLDTRKEGEWWAEMEEVFHTD